VASLVAVAVLKDLGVKSEQDISAMGIRAEECSSWFTGRHGGHLGSRAALGLLHATELDTAKHVSTGATFAESIDAAGFQSESVRKGPPPLSKSNVRGFIELHIEQGPVLATEDAPIGIVTSIRGTLRVRDAHCIGAYSHSGAVPQHMRRDAVLATAELINRLDQRCEALRTAGRDVVFAIGRIHTDANVDGLTKVAGEVRFTVDLRSQERELLSDLAMEMDQLAAEIGSRRNVQFEFGGQTLAEPTIMESRFQSVLSDSARALGLRAPQVACGAGHDAAEFVRAGIPSCMIFVRNTGESHNPDEHMEMSDFRAGVLLLANFLERNLCSR
jgi:beta-ureidopropionase / N-carbamoyl-L-amino-acid hydrolase